MLDENEKLLTHPAPSNGMDKPLFARVVPWQGLSDDEIAKLNLDGYADEGELDFARAIEQELKRKNGFNDVKEKNT